MMAPVVSRYYARHLLGKETHAHSSTSGARSASPARAAPAAAAAAARADAHRLVRASARPTTARASLAHANRSRNRACSDGRRARGEGDAGRGAAARRREQRRSASLAGVLGVQRDLGQHVPGHQHRQRRAGAGLGGDAAACAGDGPAGRLVARARRGAPDRRRPARGARVRRAAVRRQLPAALLGRKDRPVGAVSGDVRDAADDQRVPRARASAWSGSRCPRWSARSPPSPASSCSSLRA